MMDYTSKYKVEYAFAENFCTVTEWFSFEDYIEAENAKLAAEDAAFTLGSDKSLFKVQKVELNEFSAWDVVGEPYYFSFDSEGVIEIIQRKSGCKKCKYPCEYTGKEFKPITISELYDMGYILCDYYTEEDD